jgi:GST-like protein
LLYLVGKDRPLSRHPGRPAGPLSWLMFIATGSGPLFRQAHFQYFAPEDQAHAINRYRREAERSGLRSRTTILKDRALSRRQRIITLPTCPPGAGSNARHGREHDG